MKIKSKLVPLRCETCHKNFAPRKKKRFCSTTCADRARKIKARYNTTPAAIYAIYQKQSGRCAICDAKGDIHELGFVTKQSFNIDHDHYSGVIRGLLCGECNRGLGLFKDNRLYLENAIKYLTDHSVSRNHDEEKKT